jgi:lipoprotein-anchoring transpeptidase ErfK/SrfK
MMYENGVLLREMVVSTGRAGQATITGNFRVKTKLERPFSHLWNMWLPKWLGIYDVGRYENGFHAVPVTPEGQVLWRENLGTPVSYGCVVTSEADAEILYNWAEIGTLFIIRN